jgi:hypothetical protein
MSSRILSKATARTFGAGIKVLSRARLKAGERIGRRCLRSRWHNSRPVTIEGVDKIEGGFDEVPGDLALGDQVHGREEEKRLVRSAMAGDSRVTVPTSVGAKLRR